MYNDGSDRLDNTESEYQNTLRTNLLKYLISTELKCLLAEY